MVMQFAQFVDHDLTLTPIHKGFHESIPSCRPCNSRQTVHPECNPFPVPAGDFYYPEVNVTSGERFCFPSMRSLPGQQSLGPRDQINQNTHFLDGSMVYGETTCLSNKLRGFSGRMNSTQMRGKELLPLGPHPECKSRNGLCFLGGDDRASEQPGLTAIHTAFLREHNRIVEGLRGVNPHWNGEQLFHHARKIVSAQVQHIVFNEFLPRILSWNAVNLYGLKLLPQGYYKDYNPSCSPIVFNEFAAAAFRIGHSLLRPHIPRLSVQHQPVEPPLLLRDGFFRMDALLQPGIIDEILRGLVATPMETLDQFITGEVTNHLFEDRKIPFSGIDLIALNIQRGLFFLLHRHINRRIYHYRFSLQLVIMEYPRTTTTEPFAIWNAPPTGTTWAARFPPRSSTGSRRSTPAWMTLICSLVPWLNVRCKAVWLDPLWPASLASSSGSCANAIASGTRIRTQRSSSRRLSWLRSVRWRWPRSCARTWRSPEICSVLPLICLAISCE